ncbi:hypothetical protein IVA82_24485 [Bradyrhizobium sp. 142]|nr:hypothetical protein [Bradyrhizobium sp. 142]MCK1728245.1 hypothetical protein [Bradyrhizobium sp. 142]
MTYSEEIGIRGADELEDQYKSEGKNVIAVLQMDMSGFKGAEQDIYLIYDLVSLELNAFLGKSLQEYNLTGVHQITRAETHAATRARIISRGPGTAGMPPFRSRQRSRTRIVQSTARRIRSLCWTPMGAHHARFAKLGIAFLIEAAKSADGASAQPGEKRAVLLYLALRGCRKGRCLSWSRCSGQASRLNFVPGCHVYRL